MAELPVPHCYSLTNLTLRSNQHRRVVIHGFDVRRRSFIIFLVALVPGLILTGFFWVFIGQYAVVMFGVAQAAAFWTVERRSSSGLRLRTYQTMLDKRRSTTGQFFMCGHPFDPSTTVEKKLVQSTVPVRSELVDDTREMSAQLDDIYS